MPPNNFKAIITTKKKSIRQVDEYHPSVIDFSSETSRERNLSPNPYCSGYGLLDQIDFAAQIKPYEAPRSKSSLSQQSKK